MENINFDEIYKENKKFIKKWAYTYSNYFNVDMSDLLSESNIIFINCKNRYTNPKTTFTAYFRSILIKHLKHYCYREITRRVKQDKIRDSFWDTLTDGNYRKSVKTTKDNHSIWYLSTCSFSLLSLEDQKNNETKKLDVNKNIESIINHIIEFCMQPNYMDKLKPYMGKSNPYVNTKKWNKDKANIFVIKSYFNKEFGYGEHSLRKAVAGIKLMLEKEMI